MKDVTRSIADDQLFEIMVSVVEQCETYNDCELCACHRECHSTWNKLSAQLNHRPMKYEEFLEYNRLFNEIMCKARGYGYEKGRQGILKLVMVNAG